jgi:SAM-dependent methyltransferase
MAEQKKYFAADADFDDELERTRLREQELDPITFRRLVHIGVSEGWHCLEVGAGGGSIARWLAERVGPSGHLVVVDIDTRLIGDLNVPNVEVQRSDITKAELEADGYDLIHCRHLLMHLADPEAVLRRFVRALRPNGWLLAEEADVTTWVAVDRAHPLAGAHDAIIRKIFESCGPVIGIDPFLGRALPEMFNRVGLVELGNEGVARIIRGGDPWARYLEKTLERTDDVLVTKGLLTQSEISERRRALEDPKFYFRDLLFDASWGRRAP